MGTPYYTMEYTVQSASWFRHNVAVFAVRYGSSSSSVVHCKEAMSCAERASSIRLMLNAQKRSGMNGESLSRWRLTVFTSFPVKPPYSSEWSLVADRDICCNNTSIEAVSSLKYSVLVSSSCIAFSAVFFRFLRKSPKTSSAQGELEARQRRTQLKAVEDITHLWVLGHG